METLSFSCPKCGKLHERVKTEMVGHKVQCQCSYVFRLGSKSDKKPGIAKELNRKKEFRKQQEISQARSKSQKLTDEVVDAIQVEASDRQGTGLSPPSFGDPFDLMDEIPSELLSDALLDPHPAFSAAANPLPVSAPRRQTTKRKGASSRIRPKGERQLKSPAGPIWTIFLGFFGVPWLFVIILIFVSSAFDSQRLANPFQQAGMTGVASGSISLISLSAIGMSVLFSVLAICLLVSSVFAVIELSKRTHIGWPSRVAAIVASITLVCLLGLFVWRFVGLFTAIEAIQEMGRQTGRTVNQSAIGWGVARMIFAFFACAVVPLIAAITGFARSMKR